MRGYSGDSSPSETAAAMSAETRHLLTNMQARRTDGGWEVHTRSGQYHFSDDGKMKTAIGSAELGDHAAEAIRQELRRIEGISRRNVRGRF